jgi:signal transduction histidine kinase/ligand-binding sensor domain-containing protein/DNA-binding response OmpR family regulator
MKGSRIFRYISLYFLSSFATLSPVTGQLGNFNNSDVWFKELPTRQGLSQSSVLCFVQDENGFVWIGTKDGLNRYDGYDLISFRHDPSNTNSISNNEITCLYSDPKGLLWIGTRGGGLNLLNRKTNQITRFSNVANDNIIRTIFRAENGVLWIGTSNGLIKVHENAQKFSFENVSVKSGYKSIVGQPAVLKKSILSIVSIKEISSDHFLVGTDGGLYAYTPSVNEFRNVELVDNMYVSTVTSILIDKKGSLWLGTYEGLLKVESSDKWKFKVTAFNNKQKGDHYLKSCRIETLTTDALGNIWAGTRGNGLIKITNNKIASDYTNDYLDNKSISDNIINSLMIDKTGVLWIGTESRGCNMFDLYHKKFSYIRYIPNRANSLGNNLVTAITGNGSNQLWVGSAEGGIDQISLDNNNLNIKHFKDIKVGKKTSSEIISLLEDSNHDLWVGAATNQIGQFRNGKSIKSYATNGFVFSIYEDKQKRIWFGTWGQGLGLINKTTGQIINYPFIQGSDKSLSSDKVLAIYHDRIGNLWVGTKGGGLNVCPANDIIRQNQHFTSYTSQQDKAKSISNNDVYCIMQDSRGIIWAGTGGGLNKLIPASKKDILAGHQRFVSYTEKDGLPNNTIYGIIEDSHGNLWLSTNNGLCLFDPRTNRCKNYYASDGLQSNEFHANAFYKDKHGYMYVGGVNGLTSFNPDSIHDNPFKPTVSLTNFKVFDQNISAGIKTKTGNRNILSTDISKTKEVTLSFHDKEITFEFSAMHYSNSQKIKYAYRLLGFNDKWQEISNGERSVTYTNLNSGNYTFQVKATNNDGIWSDKPVELKITIRSPFWLSYWFSIVYIMIIAGGLYLFRKYSIIAVKEKNRLLIEHIENKKQTEVAEAKARFFANISHEIRTPLTLIYDPLERVLEEGRMDEKTRNQLNTMSKNVNRLMSLINQLLQIQKIDTGFVSLKVEKTKISPFLHEIVGNFEQKAAIKNISLSIDNKAETTSLWFDHECMTTVFYNLLSNAIKFTPENGKISIKIDQYQGDFNKTILQGLKLRLKLRHKHQNWVSIEIKDNGSGISAKEIHRIFDRFYQVNKPEFYHYAGSGIGLSLVKEYIELHKGHIEVNSQPGKGSSFIIYLKEGKTHFKSEQIDNKAKQNLDRITNSIPVDIPAEQNSIESDSDENFESPHLLIIEDDVELAKYIKDSLRNIYRITISKSGDYGIDLAQKLSPSLIVSDVMLPGINGFDICKSIKTDVATSHIPVILLTARASDEDIIAGYEYGADSYITKPFNIKILAAQIKMLLESRSSLRGSFNKKIALTPSETTISSLDEQFFKKLMDVSDTRLSDDNFDVSVLVEAMNMSHSAVLKKIKAITGLSPVDFIKSMRLKKAAQILQKGKYPIAEVCYMVGFSDPKYFSKCFVKEFGKTPSEFCNNYSSSIVKVEQE